MKLNDIARYIECNGHLPGVPSAECMVEQGLDVARIDAVFLEKIEEITLHLIRMEQRLLDLELENAALKQRPKQIQEEP